MEETPASRVGSTWLFPNSVGFRYYREGAYVAPR